MNLEQCKVNPAQNPINRRKFLAGQWDGSEEKNDSTKESEAPKEKVADGEDSGMDRRDFLKGKWNN